MSMATHVARAFQARVGGPERAVLLFVAAVAIAAPAAAQSVTFAKDIAPLVADRCGMCHHPGGSAPFSLLTYARREAPRDADRDRHQVALHAAVESGSGLRPVRRPASAERRGDRSHPALGRRRRASKGDRARSAAPRRKWTERVAARHSPISSSRCRSRTRCRPTAPTCSASSSFRCRSIACATCAGSSSGPAIRTSSTTRTSAWTRRRRRARSTTPIPGPATAG